jgi:hypothetical protein
MESGAPRFAVLLSRADRQQTISIVERGRWRGLFTGTVLELHGPTEVALPAGFRDLFEIVWRSGRP